MIGGADAQIRIPCAIFRQSNQNLHFKIETRIQGYPGKDPSQLVEPMMIMTMTIFLITKSLLVHFFN